MSNKLKIDEMNDYSPRVIAKKMWITTSENEDTNYNYIIKLIVDKVLLAVDKSVSGSKIPRWVVPGYEIVRYLREDRKMKI